MKAIKIIKTPIIMMIIEQLTIELTISHTMHKNEYTPLHSPLYPTSTEQLGN